MESGWVGRSRNVIQGRRDGEEAKVHETLATGGAARAKHTATSSLNCDTLTFVNDGMCLPESTESSNKSPRNEWDSEVLRSSHGIDWRGAINGATGEDSIKGWQNIWTSFQLGTAKR
jgi:hypothetical protein